MFKKVLVANRGDVALRVMRACRELGVKTVAVYSDVDRNALHVRYADEAFPIGEALSRASYLNISKIVDVAIRSRADAIHPGYGFLAENPRFAQVCSEAELTFIGPDDATIRTLGDRLRLREWLHQRGFPVLSAGQAGMDEGDVREIAQRVGFPLMVRPVAGTGGRGERLVTTEEDLDEMLAAARREAETAFGDGAVYLEGALPGVRHIAVQVLADSHGNAVCLGDSEGTIQRRHQKLIEESPSPALTANQRIQIQQMANDIARALGYVTAGTIEFLLDSDGQFYFSEMHPRLHVEHPVIEMVSGIDVVKEQIRIASGRRLRHTQASIHGHGSAIECRIMAEDPYRAFEPSLGRITRLVEPGGPGVRVESGIGEGSEISHYYDPLLSKVIAWGANRGEAIMRVRRALDEYRIAGVKTNIPFLQQIMNRTSFIGGQFDLSQDDQYFSMVQQNRDDLAEICAIAAAWLANRDRTRSAQGSGLRRQPSPWKVTGRWGEMTE